jgi:RNA-directed DNA polymerase
MRPSARKTKYRIVTGWKPGFANRPVNSDYRSLPYSRSSLGGGFTHISGKNGLGRFMVRRTTIRKRMRAKLREVKQQLRKRMHDPVPQTGGWLKSVVQGYFNYYAVPGNLTSLGVFRDRVIALWWRTIRRRSQKRRISWTRTLALAQRWLPQPRALHPFPDARFAATHPR